MLSGVGILIRWNDPEPPLTEAMERLLEHRGGVARSVRQAPAALTQCSTGVPVDPRATGPVRHVAQPWFAVTDSRIDNGAEIRRQLEGRVQHPLTSDADLLLGAYELWGTELCSHLIGDFAFVIWDEARQRAVLGRDHLGSRPLYLSQGPGWFVAASTPRALMETTPISRELDEVFFAEFLACTALERHSTDDSMKARRTTWKHVQRLAPAHVAVVTAAGTRERRYWALETRDDPWTFDAAVDAVRATFDRAVADRLRGSGPVAIEVSGGLDSSSVAASALAQGGDVRLFGQIYPGWDCDESEYSLAVASHLGVPLEQFDMTRVAPANPRPESDATGWLSGVIDSASWVPFYRSMHETGHSAYLTGQFGDHVFDPCRSVVDDLVNQGRVLGAISWQRTVRRSTFPVAARAVGHRTLRRARISLLKAGHEIAPVGTERILRRRQRGVVSAECPWLTSPLLDAMPLVLPARQRGRWSRSRYERSQRIPSDGSVSELLERWSHGDTMVPIEGRHPFADVRLVELVHDLPEVIVTPGGQRRELQRKALAFRLPAVVRERPDKAEFSTALTRHAPGWLAHFDLAAEEAPSLVDRAALHRAWETALSSTSGINDEYSSWHLSRATIAAQWLLDQTAGQ